MEKSYPKIEKQDGTLESFHPKKLEFSLLRAGADKELVSAIVAHIKDEIREGDSTSTIYQHAFSLLKNRSAQVPAARYSMKRAVRELGPSGFPFEKFIAEIFKARGYKTETGSVIKGKCATHEVDMVAEKDGKKILAEIKFHNNLGITSDLKVALYVDARFVDLGIGTLSEGWLITNTRFTRNAIKYGECRNLHMLSWSYPQNSGLQNLIEESGVQPITALPSLSGHEKRQLLDQGIVLCRMLNAEPPNLSAIFSKEKLEEVLIESKALCGGGKGV